MTAASASDRPLRRRLWAIFVLAIALAVVPYASTASTPLLQLNPITVAGGTAQLAGTLGSQASGSSLTVNGHRSASTRPVRLPAASISTERAPSHSGSRIRPADRPSSRSR